MRTNFDPVKMERLARRDAMIRFVVEDLEKRGHSRKKALELAVITSYSIHYTKLYEKVLKDQRREYAEASEETPITLEWAGKRGRVLENT